MSERSIFNLFGVPVETSVAIPVPPVKSTLNPSVIFIAEPVSPSKLHEVYCPAGTAQALSPLKNLVLSGEPLAERSIVPIVTAPVALVLAVVADIKVPLAFVKLVTPEPVPSISIHAAPL